MKISWTIWKPVAVTVWIAGWLYCTRYSLLDDALIHLRYADYLHSGHMISYDGVHASFGTSSLLYVGLLAVLRGVTASPLLPKMVSATCYCLLIGSLMLVATRLWRRREGRWLLTGLLLCLLAPMGVRWLSDGMETSLVMLAVLGLALVAVQQSHAARSSIGHRFLLVLFGFALILLRIELASVVGLACAIIFVSRMSGLAMGGLWRSLLVAAPLAVGAALAMAAIHLHFGTLLPDTALAKSGGAPLGVLQGAVHVLLSSILLGAGAFIVWIASAALALRAFLRAPKRPRMALLWLLGNAIFPVVILLSSVRGQAVQGVRYLVWALLFSVTWNALEMDWLAIEENAKSRLPMMMATAGLVVFAVLLPVDWRYAWRLMQGRNATYKQMLGAHLSSFAGKEVLAGDVGFVGYFTQGDVCDIEGLVNGRAAAKLDFPARAALCAARKPDVLFLTEGQTAAMGAWVPLLDWVVCQHFDFANVHSLDRHYFMVKKQDAGGCRRDGWSAG